VLALIGFPVAVNPPGPVHANVYGPVPPEATAVTDAGSAEAHEATAATVTVGSGSTVTSSSQDVLQPPAPLVIATCAV
jgi:hypothetical protein